MGSETLLLLLALASPAPATTTRTTPEAPAGLAKATFAGGCFWCMQRPFDETPGVVSTTVGYTGGTKSDPTYEEVSSGTTGHAESIEVLYDPSKVSYQKLLDIFWHNVDPLTPNGQFCDHGTQYRTAIFFHDEAQKRLAEESRKDIEARLERPVVTQVAAAGPFYRAEEYHQSYYRKNPIRYHLYRSGCGRDERLREIWGAAAGQPPAKTD